LPGIALGCRFPSEIIVLFRFCLCHPPFFPFLRAAAAFFVLVMEPSATAAGFLTAAEFFGILCVDADELTFDASIGVYSVAIHLSYPFMLAVAVQRVRAGPYLLECAAIAQFAIKDAAKASFANFSVGLGARVILFNFAIDHGPCGYLSFGALYHFYNCFNLGHKMND
jgi:hypothetical protein